MNATRVIPIQGTIEVGSVVVVTGPRFTGRIGRVVNIFNAGTTATVRGNFGSWRHKERVKHFFSVEHLSLFTSDMDESTGEYH